MKRFLSALVLASFVAVPVLHAVGGDKAQYMGGTVAGLKEKAEGTLSTQSATDLVFSTKKDGSVTIPYTSIDSLEYGQKAGRRVAMAVMISPLALFSKKRNHYLTIAYKDAAGADQAAVFELGKDIVRTTLTVLEVRSKKDIEFQDDEARKALGGGK